MEQALLILIVIFAATFIRAAMGFGDALIAMPLLALITGMQIATPLVALCATTIAIIMLVRIWRQVSLKAAWRLIVSTLAGIPVGLFFLKNAPEGLIKGILGLVLIVFGLYNLIVPRFPTLKSDGPAYLFGFVAGILGGAYNTNGPPIVIFGILRRWPPKRFRATLQGYFLPSGLMITAGHALAGLWAPPVLKLYVMGLPVILLAIFLGIKAANRVSGRHFEGLVHLFLVAMGIMLLV